ncbi:acetyl-CoA C-acyltransferase [Achromobacter ruhlandii]|uniref:acetyl-CoA C-acyltransferase n=1 Tax=Achromobacter ruhlandii TaxID=72557 RepID=A0ABM8M3G9_9BURK|nr:acetyl-CoA C-acyltransferase [Achromobacter ruhlandii]AKP89646.1 3-ketoacyl-CoA thiolase [Achromobacter xylosoxidans]AOU92499.1 3-ketoacyl-CoA thiolase/acetyl-CoA acetyltransferase [Achromobacter ruhlandii]MCZ8430983.1 acetyl-CoA C-acyltransferase [Achromobacter ruhlandii]MDC6087666.1 acetyl-CoA C-acyltransferase [Achromobacter ruhlandii]MDC6150453.1 acetyl-CoA C-acyltransferase [Achromobacter ruhlandii]
MSKQIQEAYIVAATRLPVGKRNGVYATTRPDDMLAAALQGVLKQTPWLDPARIDDVITGCAMPEAEQGMNVARIGLLLAGLPQSVAGVTVNRFCASGLQAVADAAARIRSGEVDIMIGSGTESMSAMPQIMGNKVSLNPAIFSHPENVGMAFGMGLTGEKVAEQWKVSREDQDAFALASQQKANAAIAAGHFRAETTPFEVVTRLPGGSKGEVSETRRLVEVDEGPRPDSSAEGLARLKPVFAARGSVTAGNSSQMSDGAAAVVLVSERVLREFNLSPLARFVSYSVAGVPPEIMGIGPMAAIPKVLARAGIAQDDLDWIELNEAFAAQSLAVIRELKLDPSKINPLGGAIALGHPLGATGAIRTATLMHGLRRTGGKYGMVTMCIGTGMGAAGLFEAM